MLAQAAENSNRGLLIGLLALAIPALGGTLAGVAALLSNRRQARSDSRSRVREDLGFTLEEYRRLIDRYRTRIEDQDKQIAEDETRLAGLEAALAKAQEELRRCRERARTRRR